MTLDESVSWVTGVRPSRLDEEIYETHSYRDLRTLLKVKVGCMYASIIQEYQTLAKIATEVFGSEPRSEPSKNFDDAARRLGGIFGGKVAVG